MKHKFHQLLFLSLKAFKNGCSYSLIFLLTLFLFANEIKAQINKEKYLGALKASENTVSFEENKGQWEPNVLAQAHTSIGEMVVKKDEIYFLSLKEKETSAQEDDDTNSYDAHGWGISFSGFNPGFAITKSNAFETKYNYFIGSDPAHYSTDVSAFGELNLQNIYNGIDLRLYSQKKRQIEFDWIVNAGADYTKIKMHFKGQEGLSVDEKGNLNVRLQFDDVKFEIPEAYQVINGERVPVKIAFSVKDNDASFRIASKIDNHYPLIIESKKLRWGVWMDGNDNNFDEYLFAVDEDSAGNVFCGGAINVQLTRSYLGSAIYGFDSTYNDGINGNNGNHRDGIIYEIKNDGTALLRVTYYGSVNPDAIYGLSLSPDKSTVFACGYCSGDIPLAGTPFDGTRQGVDGFVAVFSADLKTLLYSSYIGGAGTGINSPNLPNGDQTDRMVTVRALNNTDFVIGGRVNGAMQSSFIKNAYDGVYNSGLDMYIARFTNYNNLIFGTYIGGSSDDDLNDVNVFSDGSVAFSGYTSSTTGFPVLVNAAGSASANQDGVVGVIPAGGGNFSMLSRIGGSDSDVFNGLTIGLGDTIYVTGYSHSANFPLGTGASAANRFRAVLAGSNDGILGKIPKQGKTTINDPWIATYFGGTGDDRGNTIRSYANGSTIMIFGETGSQAGGANGFPVRNLNIGGNTFYDSTFNGGTWDMFFFTIGTDLKTELFCTYVGGKNNDYLGETGAPAGSNHFMVEGDSLILLGTTSHSDTLNPNVIGPVSGPNQVFDFTHGPATQSRDVHLVFKWRIGAILGYDFGDAPRYYGAARHTIYPNLLLGALIDAEDFYPVSPGTKANVDDLTGIDDEDAIPGTQVSIQDTATQYSVTIPLVNTTGDTATLMAWIDFNRDSIFENSEVDTVRVPSGATSATLKWSGFYSVFNAGVSDTTYMRIRITTDSAFNVQFPNDSNNASNGEVEDYLVVRYHCVSLTTAAISNQNPSMCNDTTGSITISNANLSPNVIYTIYYNKNSVAVGPLYITAQNNGTLTISHLGAGSYSGIRVFHPTDSLCGDIISGPVLISNPDNSFGDTIAVACDKYAWYGTIYTLSSNAPTHLFPHGNKAGCDSTVTLHLAINHSSAGTESATACDSYVWNGATYTAGGIQTHFFPGGNAAGCDSTATLSLIINHSTAGNESAIACDTYLWNGTTYTASGSQTHLFSGGNVAGCDSTAMLHLTINYSTAGSESATACDSYIWNGATYTSSSNQTHLFAGGNAAGCDSTAMLHLTINYSTAGSESAIACDSYLWNGTTYTSSGKPTYLFAGGNAAGCDSTATLHLVINKSTASAQTITACDSYIWNGTTYTASGNQTYFLAGGNAAGCDSTATIALTVNHSTTGSEATTACDSYIWNGTTYTTSGNQTHFFAGGNVAGCDSTATLYLTINRNTSGSESATACDSYTWNGTTYTASGNPIHLFSGGNAAGCDSLVTLHLVINYSNTVSQIEIACDSFTWSANGQTYAASGEYGLYNGAACFSDSLHLTINSSPAPLVTVTNYCGYTVLTVTNMTGSLNWNTADTSSSITVIAPGTYSVTQTLNGCYSPLTAVAVTVFPASPPTPVISIINDTLYCKIDPTYLSYQWYFDTTLVTGATDSYYYAMQTGNYNVSVTDTNGCSIAVGINVVITGTKNYEWEWNSISISPNPATSELIINASIFNNEVLTISLINVVGEIIEENKLRWNDAVNVNISRLPAGTYFIQMKSDKGTFVKRFVKD